MNPPMKKILLMGQKKVGKTSMHSIIFASCPPRETSGIGLTVDVNQNHLKLMGNLALNLWDCGGQENLIAQYLSTQKEQIFSNVSLLIFVFDVENEGQKANEELEVFQSIISTLATYSPNSNVFILIHKFDKIKEIERKAVYERKHREISQRADNINVQIKDIYATSIWDETLYKAWSFIVQSLIPNIEIISKSLQQLNDICSCDEVVLFEKSTFLIISFHTLVNNKSADVNKYERLANIIKQFKLSCKKVDMQIKTIQVRQSKFTTYIDEFSDNTFIMLVYFDQSIQPSSVIHNIQQAKLMFESVQGYDADKLKLLLGK